ncbi:Threonine-tRNA ligase [Quillaja saponaria]|uniref:Threonine-tRNA ligase n=1 Tax=Quillaja saponaria TaxID=32244 RepID=A0AAD7PZR8_QUISA|nr:Threonine-tRNA ligase [Quillaja saponaria]
MGESTKPSDLEQLLRPLYQRAAEAEDRLSIIEAALSDKNGVGIGDASKMISDLRRKLEDANTELKYANAELISEREKAQKLAAENAKLQYRTIHLVQAVKETDLKLEQVKTDRGAS